MEAVTTMTDSPKFTPHSFPKSWEDQPACREVFLVHLPPHLAEACQNLGRFFFTALLEGHMSEAEPADMVRGAAADLYHVCLVLKSLLDGYEHLNLLDRVPDWKDRVCQVADEMKSMTERHAA